MVKRLGVTLSRTITSGWSPYLATLMCHSLKTTNEIYDSQNTAPKVFFEFMTTEMRIL